MSEPAKKKQKTSHTAIIAEPLADKKLTKRILKLNKKGTFLTNLALSPSPLHSFVNYFAFRFVSSASKEKGLRRGVKEVIKAVKKKETGYDFNQAASRFSNLLHAGGAIFAHFCDSCLFV
jgi:hypothetical protein